MPFDNKAETEKMVDELRVLGMQKLQMQMLEQKKEKAKQLKS